MKRRKLFFILAIVVILFSTGFLILNFEKKGSQVQIQNLELDKIRYVKVAGQTLRVDLALTREAQAQGLSGRKELKEGEGMLFVFDHADMYPFWMKDMNFPIDIIWIAGENFSDMRVVYIKENALPESFPETFGPRENAKYVLEVESYFSEKNNLKKGDKVEFLP